MFCYGVKQRVIDLSKAWRCGHTSPWLIEIALSVSIQTCASVSPSVAASCLRSGLVMYFCIWKRRSRPFRCRLLNTARDHERLRLPLDVTSQRPFVLADALDTGSRYTGGDVVRSKIPFLRRLMRHRLDRFFYCLIYATWAIRIAVMGRVFNVFVKN